MMRNDELITDQNSLANWLEYVTKLHTATIVLGLERSQQVADNLQLLPFPKFVITVAGTNGKGTTVALLETLFLTANYRVAAYTSPHLLNFNERIKINGSPVSDNILCEAFTVVEQARGDVPLTYFEFTTLVALWIFKQTPLDVVLLEVGMGGRLDAVNIVDADIAVITTIALDHMDYLGNTREKIAQEKAGIMRSHKPVICGDRDPPSTISTAATASQAQLYQYGKDYFYQQNSATTWQWHNNQRSLTELPIPKIPLQNAATVLQVLTLLPTSFIISEKIIKLVLEKVRLSGRFQIVEGAINCILDVAHNPESALYLAEKLKNTPCQGRTLAVFGMLADKDQQNTVKPLLPLIAEWFIGNLPVTRASSAVKLANVLATAGVANIHVCDTVATAYNQAMAAAQQGDRILVFGSFHTVAAVIAVIAKV